MKKIIMIGFMQLAWGHSFSQSVSTSRYPEQKAITQVLQADNINNRIAEDDSIFIPDHVTPDFHGWVPFLDKQAYKNQYVGGVSRISSPTPCLNFLGLNDNETTSTTTPPDVNGAVGISHLLVTQNTGVKIQSKTTGLPMQLKSLKSFFSPVSAVAPFDPKALYDPYENRWIVTCADQATSLLSRLLFAVSQTPDPLGAWHFYVIDVDPANSTWLDYPSLGFNKNWIVISGNMYNNANAFVSNSIFAVNKATAYAGTMNVTRFSINNAGATICPSITYDNNLETEWLCNNWNSSTGGAGYLRLYTITGTPSSPVFTPTTFYPSTFSPWNSDQQIINTYQCNNINIGDSRIRSLVFQQGSLWACQKVGLPVSSPTRVAVQWWEINPGNGLTTQFGRVEDIGGFNLYFNPSLAVNDNKDVLVGYSHYSAAHIYPAAAYSFRTATNPAGVLQTYYDYRTSNRMDCRGRWGDYSSTVLDPNRANLWTLQEYIPNGTGAGSWWAQICLTLSCIPIQTITAPVSTPNIKYEASDHVTGSSVINPPNGFVKFDGAKYVELNPGFRTQITTGYFDAYIDGCGGLRMSEKGVNNIMSKVESTDSIPPDHAIRLAEFKVYPNPANDILYINIPDENDPILQVSVWDVLGKKVSNKSNLPYQSSIDISRFPKGIYFLTIKTQKKEYKTNFIKQ